jgi:drug/metabolite transporter (DMT)-like permease
MKFKAYFLVLLTTFFWGLTFHLSKYALEYISPLQVAVYRFFYASIFLILYISFTYKIHVLKTLQYLFFKFKIKYREIFIMSFIGIFIFNYFFYKGIKLTNPATSAILMASNPALTSLILRILKKEKQNFYRILGIFISFIGVFITIVNSYKNKNIFSWNWGDFFILIASLSWAMYGILGKDFIEKQSKNFNETEITIINIVLGTLMLIFSSIFDQTFLKIHYNAFRFDIFLILIFMGIFSSGLAYIWWYQSIKIIGTTKTSIFMNVVPIMAVLIDYLLYNNISLFQIIGGLCVILGVSITILK